ncbi:MAG TPA: substrate-binding domain-containing protein, partial [Ktedonobacteraceae bacterium]
MKDSAMRLGRALLSYFLFSFLCVELVGCNVLPVNSSPTRASHIRIASSAALLPLISAVGALFERQHPEARIAVQHYESVDGLNRLADQRVDIAATTLYADPSVVSAAHLRDALFGVVPYLIVVQHDAPLASLSQAQIQRIF